MIIKAKYALVVDTFTIHNYIELLCYLCMNIMKKSS